ncbi:cysteine protease [Actinomyces viscosus]|uniref:cysteine protease n=1 Tax=Actinomyces viscosus TaxID=1656 RepID=UPI000F846C55|nr:cysteine protease [Actinomyces viscosus]TFH50988.1 cysteine protease [Actinomyces viscosus]
MLDTYAGVLDTYAGVLERAHAMAAELRVQAARLLVTAIASPATAPACEVLAATITSAFDGLLSTVDMAATHTATSLTTGAGGSDRAASAKGKGGGNDAAKDKRGFGQDLERLKEQADGKGDWDPDANQTIIPDCFMLVTLQGYSATEEGQQFLRDHVRWDEGKNCFVVTLYDDGKPVDVEVRDYYANGSTDEYGRPTLMSIYERAYGEKFGEEGLNNRPPSEAMERISGHAATVVDTEGGPGFFGWFTGEDHKYTGKEWATIDRAVDEGRPVVAVTAEDIKENTTVRAVTDTNGDGKIDTKNKGAHGEVLDQEGTRVLGGGHKTQDGEKSAHAYTVVAVDDQYVTLRNPWGMNPTPEAEHADNGLIRISREDYERYFSQTSIGEDPE